MTRRWSWNIFRHKDDLVHAYGQIFATAQMFCAYKMIQELAVHYSWDQTEATYIDLDNSQKFYDQNNTFL